MATPEAHPFANIFPLLTESDLGALAADIKNHGLHEPVWLFEGRVLDGRNRLAACALADVGPTFQEFKGSREQAAQFIWSLNFKRRHLSPSQAAVCVVEFEDVLANLTAEAAAKQRAQGSRGREGGRGNKKPLPSLEGKGLRRAPTTAITMAQYAHVGHASVERAKALKKASPSKFAEVKAGDKSLSQATREQKRQQTRQLDLPPGQYRVLYADPPWKYSNSGIIDEADSYGHAERHYSAMTIAELCALDVVSRVADDAVLFLWATSALLAECWPVIKAWGFTYKTSMVWNKELHNWGPYVSVRHELLLIATRGSCTPDHPTPMPGSVQTIQRSNVHSEKPEEFRQLIAGLYDGPRLELFARTRHDGWSCFGNDARLWPAPAQAEPLA